MKIVVDARMIESSGIGRYIESILPEIVKHFRDVILLGDAVKLHKKLKLSKNFQVIPFADSIYSLSEQLKYPFIIPECDIFFSPHYNVPLLPIRARHRITTIHDVHHLAFREKLSFPQKLYAKLVMKCAMEKSDAVITVSNFSKKEIIKYTSEKYKDKVSVIHNGEIFCEKEIRKGVRPIEDPYLLFVGNVRPHKNLKKAVDAFRLLLLDTSVSEKNLRFLIVGEREKFITGDTDIVGYIDGYELLRERVTFTGKVSDDELVCLYVHAQAFVFPSFYEGFGFPPLESMALQVPVIASNVSSIPEICGDAALYFDPFNIEDIYTKMKQILFDENLRDILIKNGLNNLKNFTKEESISNHIRLFENFS
jgi:glycosyltransferase involved in cell wall biosynthesis